MFQIATTALNVDRTVSDIVNIDNIMFFLLLFLFSFFLKVKAKWKDATFGLATIFQVQNI